MPKVVIAESTLFFKDNIEQARQTQANLHASIAERNELSRQLELQVAAHGKLLANIEGKDKHIQELENQIDTRLRVGQSWADATEEAQLPTAGVDRSKEFLEQNSSPDLPREGTRPAGTDPGAGGCVEAAAPGGSGLPTLARNESMKKEAGVVH